MLSSRQQSYCLKRIFFFKSSHNVSISTKDYPEVKDLLERGGIDATKQLLLKLHIIGLHISQQPLSIDHPATNRQFPSQTESTHAISSTFRPIEAAIPIFAGTSFLLGNVPSPHHGAPTRPFQDDRFYPSTSGRIRPRSGCCDTR